MDIRARRGSPTLIMEREHEQIERANASTATPVVFIHGLWLLPSSWDRWAAFFEEAGYVPLTPGWPDDPETVEGARAEPEILANKTLEQISHHTTEIIGALDKKPVLIGHSTGGLLAEMLAARGLDCGHRPRRLPWRPAIANPRAQVGWPVPDQPAESPPRDHAHVRPIQVRVGERAGRAGGERALRHLPRRRLRDLPRPDGQRQPQPVDGGEGRHAEPRPRSRADHRRRGGPHGAVGDRERRLQPAAAKSRRDGDREDAEFEGTPSRSTTAGARSPRPRSRSSSGSPSRRSPKTRMRSPRCPVALRCGQGPGGPHVARRGARTAASRISPPCFGTSRGPPRSPPGS